MKKRQLFLPIIALFFILCFPLSALAQVTLSVGDGNGVPGSSGNEVAISLENLDNLVLGVQSDVCDVGDHLVITGIETTSRTEGFDCDFNELENGCARILIFSMSLEPIEKGSGPILIVKYEVKESALLGETCILNLENASVLDELNHALETTEIPGEFCFTSCAVNISPAAETVNSGGAIQFSANSPGDCLEPDYVWEVESEIGSEINDNGLYTSGYNDTSAPVTDLVTVYDLANNVSDSAEITVMLPSVRGSIKRISPEWILGSKWVPTQHYISITGKDTYFDNTSRLSFNPGYDIVHIANFSVEPNKIIAIILLNTDTESGYVDVTVTTGIEEPYTVTGEDMLRIY